MASILNREPIFPNGGDFTSYGGITVSNSDHTGGSATPIYTATRNTLVYGVGINSLGTNSGGVARIFIQKQGITVLYKEITLPATIISSIVANGRIYVDFNYQDGNRLSVGDRGMLFQSDWSILIAIEDTTMTDGYHVYTEADLIEV